jgi:hypothetical protein
VSVVRGVPLVTSSGVVRLLLVRADRLKVGDDARLQRAVVGDELDAPVRGTVVGRLCRAGVVLPEFSVSFEAI